MPSLDIALDLAAAELPVFPCNALKRPAIPRLRAGQGFKDASTDPRRIREMWRIAAKTVQLVGVPTGSASGFDVLDWDPRHDTGDWWGTNVDWLPETRTHRTMSGGWHWLFRHRPGVRNSISKIAPGVDVRGEGGYVIMPPSRGYEVIHEAELCDWPDWLLDLVLKAAAPPPRPEPSRYTPPADVTDHRIQAFIRAALDHVAGAQDGSKHYALRSAALQIGGIAARAGLSDATAIEMLIAALPSARNWDAARKTADWGLAQGRARPIALPDRDRLEWRRST